MITGDNEETAKAIASESNRNITHHAYQKQKWKRLKAKKKNTGQ